MSLVTTILLLFAGFIWGVAVAWILFLRYLRQEVEDGGGNDL